jgi:hypothetical protein
MIEDLLLGLLILFGLPLFLLVALDFISKTARG